MEDAVRAAYRHLTQDFRPGTAVPLPELRAEVERAAGRPLTRAEVDETLDLMITRPDVRLAGEANQKMLTDADREAAVEIGGETKHYLAIFD